MKKVMIFNFQTMQYEQASEAEGKEFLGLIESINADCAAQQSVQRIGLWARISKWFGAIAHR